MYSRCVVDVGVKQHGLVPSTTSLMNRFTNRPMIGELVQSVWNMTLFFRERPREHEMYTAANLIG